MIPEGEVRMLTFLADLLARTSGKNLIPQLTHTAFDELMVLDLAADVYESRFHSSGKFFSPALDGSYRHLVDYVSGHMVHPDDRELHSAFLDPSTMAERLRAAEPRGVLTCSIRYMALDGNWRQMEHVLVGGPEHGLDESRVYFYLYDAQEIRDREQGQHVGVSSSTERLRMLMPGLLTENTFFVLAQKKLAGLQGRWCMIAVDVKHFKLFRELNGPEKGEELLIRFSRHLHSLAEKTGGLACYRGQDDFGLMVPFDQPAIDRLFTTLRQEIDSLSGTSGFFPIFGICLLYDGQGSALDQFNHAALTAEEIKDDLQVHMRIYDPDAHERHVEEFRLLADFREALAKGEICFHIQPQVNVDTGRIVGAESLARWQLSDGSFISPVVFIPVLEKYGIVTDLDSFLWESVCAWLRGLVGRGIRPVPVSVNVSRITIFAMDVPARLSELVSRYGLEPSFIEVEITESAYVEDGDKISRTVAELRSRGFRVLMDDFGSGYSSLNMLRNISVDIIKLDAQFLRFSFGEEQKGINILESIINMTRSLSTPIIVEGVETPALVRYLKDVGCKYMQGFHYYRPMPPEQFEAMISLPGNVDRRGIVLQRNEQIHLREFLDDSLYSDAMINNILGPVAFYGRRGEDLDIIRYNAQFLHLIGLDAAEIDERRHHIQNYFYPDDVPGFHKMLDSAVQDRINGGDGVFRIYKPNGSVIWLQVHVYYLRTDGGTEIFYGSPRDITEMQYLNVDLPGGYYRCAVTDRFEFLYVSEGFLDMLGYTREDLKTLYNDEFARMIHPDDLKLVVDDSNNTLPSDHVDYLPFRVRHRDGHYLYVMEQSHLTDRFGGLSWQSIMVDVSEVMSLRNRMYLLEKYSTDCIVFIRRFSPPDLEIGVYGLQKQLGLSEDAFREELFSRRISILDRNGSELFGQMAAHYDDPSCLNGTYTLILPDGRTRKVHMRFSRILDKELGVECIVSFSLASGA